MSKDDISIDDWEFGSDFYQEAQTDKPLSLDDFIIKEEAPASSSITTNNTNEGFRKIAADVAQVRALFNTGRTIEDISLTLSLDPEYVRIIMITLNSISEDDSDEAVAHLVMMSL